GDYLLAHIEPRYDETREARIKKKKTDEMPKDSLAIYLLETATLEKVPFLDSYKIPDEPSEYLAYLTTRPASPKDTADTPQPTLHIRHVVSGADTAIDRVEAYEFSPDGTVLAYVK